MKRIISIVLVLVMALTLVGCEVGGKKEDKPENNKSTEAVTVKIDVKDFGTMTLELYPDKAPITVENFLTYVDEGFYDGLTFHRVYKGFMIQGGDPKGDGTGDGGHDPIKGEFSTNGVANDLSHKRGVISMARTNDPNSATSQFFICHADSDFLDGNYAAFGMMTDGFDVLDAIADVEVKMGMSGEKTTPVTPVIIDRIYRAE